jgi:hypothetical protein
MTCLPLKNGFFCLAKTDFSYPVCGKRIGITTDMRGDVRVWVKG